MLKRLGLILLIAALVGCLRGTAPPPLVYQYIIEYPPPEGKSISRTEALLKVERFTVDRIYMGTSMLFRNRALSDRMPTMNIAGGSARGIW